MKGRPATNGCRPANRGEYEIEMKGVSFRLQIIHEKYFVFNKISIITIKFKNLFQNWKNFINNIF